MPSPLDVRVQDAGRDVDELPRLEEAVVHEQQHDEPDVVRVVLGHPGHGGAGRAE